ncbi:MAG: hypothetical protein ACLRNZ_01495 [Blautia massiliensis (ex Durand et al. 2017)]
MSIFIHEKNLESTIEGSITGMGKDNKGQRHGKSTKEIPSIQAASDDREKRLGTPILTYEDIPDLQDFKTAKT